jgi:uncharacterized protein YjbI with pentapeptide repeats
VRKNLGDENYVNQNNRLRDAREQLRRLGLVRAVRVVSLEAWVLVIVVVLALLISYSIVNGKTLWDWLDLLATPIAIGVVAVIFTAWFTNQRAQDTALQAYLDKMSELLIDRKIRQERDEYDDKRITARARTLAVLTQLNGNRKRTVLQFLREARLINKKEYFGIPAHIVGLRYADLKNANLSDMPLRSSKGEAISLEGAFLQHADLRNANLTDADLSGADLTGVVLCGAVLYGANLSRANLREADLSNANLSRANLSWADLLRANLNGANLQGAKGLTQEQLEQARGD